MSRPHSATQRRGTREGSQICSSEENQHSYKAKEGGEVDVNIRKAPPSTNRPDDLEMRRGRLIRWGISEV